MAVQILPNQAESVTLTKEEFSRVRNIWWQLSALDSLLKATSDEPYVELSLLLSPLVSDFQEVMGDIEERSRGGEE